MECFVGASEVPKMLQAAHVSSCKGHFARMLTTHKMYRAGYYWPTMFKDTYEHTRKCHSCQRYSHKDIELGMHLQHLFAFGSI